MLTKIHSSICNFRKIRLSTNALIFFLVLAIGVFARVWEFGSLPPGLNVDEASSGVEAYYLYKFGVDRNGVSYPVNFISWRTGQQNALYAYLLIPFVIFGELSPFYIRLPMMLSGILSLPLMFYVSKKLGGIGFGLLCMFLMAVSPWHIVNSRWAVESNIFPFVFLIAFSFVLASKKNNKFFIAACIFFALSLYSYGTAYASVPIFLFLSIILLLYYKRVTPLTIILGLVIFTILSLPILMFIFINIFKFDTIHLGPITIPRTPLEARFQYMTALFDENPLKIAAKNTRIMFQLLWMQSDNLQWNYVEPFGYFYKITFPFAVLGFLLIAPIKAENKIPERWLVFIWMLAALSIGVIHPVNLTRINLIFTPLLICIGWFLAEANKYFKYSLALSSILLLVVFIFFNIAYHGKTYRQIASSVFNAGIIPAIEYASYNTDGEICLTDKTYFAYIYVLYVQKIHPSKYIDQIEWAYTNNPAESFPVPRQLGRFAFSGFNCSNTKKTSYIYSLKENPPDKSIQYKEKRFLKFKVFIPKR